jgi:cyclic lactone autoinducer peptide
LLPFACKQQKQEETTQMKNKIANMINKSSKIIAPFALALAIMTANSTCFFFSYQPDVPKSLDKYRMK